MKYIIAPRGPRLACSIAILQNKVNDEREFSYVVLVFSGDGDASPSHFDATGPNKNAFALLIP
jgi:hypothetical protein